MVEDRANSFLRMILQSQRERLKVFLDCSAGVGKTYQMLQEGDRLKDEGIGVVIGLLEAHGRAGQNRHLLQSLRTIQAPQEAMKVIFDWEASNESSLSNLS